VPPPVPSPPPPPGLPEDGAACNQDVAQTEEGSWPHRPTSPNAISDRGSPATPSARPLPGWDHRDATIPEPQTVFEPATAGGLPAVSMIQDFLQTMEQFLVVQERVMHGCLGTGDPLTIDPPAPHAAQRAEASEIGCSHVPMAPGELAPGRIAEHGTSPGWDAPGTRLPSAPRAEVDLGLDGRTGSRPVGGPTAPDPPFPLLGDLVSWTQGEELVSRRTFDPAEDLYLRDHTLGHEVSDADPDLLALAVMPLTMSVEILAEAAAFLMPDRTVVGVRDLRAYRWIAFDDQPQELQVTARRLGDQERILVQIRNLTEDRRENAPPASPVIEATVVLADCYPQPSLDGPRRPQDGRPSRLRPDRLYADYMFHGPSWQGVASVDQVGNDGAVATLWVLPFSGLIRSNPNPCFVLDPVVLDAAGQVIGFWTVEQLATGKVIFPFHLEALEVYGPRRPAGTAVTCVASIRLVGDQQVRSDIDVIADGGRPWYRLIGWEDKRFELPAGFHQLMRPSRQELSEPWPEPVAHLPRPHLFECRRVLASLPSDRGFWQRVWAQRVLGRAERGQFRRMAGPESQRLKWLAGRTVAKEAVRRLLRSRCGLDLPPADIEIDLDDRGRLVAGGSWTDSVAAPPVVSISQVDGLAVAVAGLPPTTGADRGESRLLMGVHIESPRPSPDRCGEPSFTSDEFHLLRGLPPETREQWVLRGWCAKEAVAKALGADLAGVLPSAAVVGVDSERGVVFVQLSDRLAGAYPHLSTDPLVVFTGLHDDLIVATTLCGCAAAESADGLEVADVQREIG